MQTESHTEINGYRWCFTLNHPENLNMTVSGSKLLVYQLEKAKNGVLHIQGYVEMEKEMRFKQMKALLPGAHIEMALGTRLHNIAYCTKMATRVSGPYMYGEIEVVPFGFGHEHHQTLDDYRISMGI